MATSLLRQKGTTSLRNKESIAAYCQEHEIPHSHDFHAQVTPDTELRAPFSEAYTLTPLQDFGLQNRDTSTVLVFESKQEESHHGEVVSAIADQVGRSLTPEVNSLYLHTSLNPNYRKAFEGKFADSVKKLAEDQNISVLHTSVGWKDKLLDFNAGHDDQANHLWRVTAFIVDSAGNDGKYGSEAKPCEPFQKHNALSHFAPLVVHVGAAALNEKTPEGWSIEGYSSANSPTFLAPVANRTKVMWKKDGPPEATIGTSAAAPYASGSLAALNCRYGQYLTREQILYAVLATCTPVTHVKAAKHKTPEPLTISYKPNAVGHVYNPEYGGFGLMHVHKADQLLAQMVALTQERPESITVPTEERVTLHVNEQDSKPDDAGLYHYHLNMPPGFALKTTVEADFVNAHGDITITSPSGTTFPMVMSKLDSDKHHFGMSTSHAWLGEKLEGSWTISSTKPIKSLRLSQHHFLEKDIIQELFIPDLLNAPPPNLHDAVPLAAHIKRVLHTSILPKRWLLMACASARMVRPPNLAT